MIGITTLFIFFQEKVKCTNFWNDPIVLWFFQKQIMQIFIMDNNFVTMSTKRQLRHLKLRNCSCLVWCLVHNRWPSRCTPLVQVVNLSSPRINDLDLLIEVRNRKTSGKLQQMKNNKLFSRIDGWDFQLHFIFGSNLRVCKGKNIVLWEMLRDQWFFGV